MINLGPQTATDTYDSMLARGKHAIRTATNEELAQELREPTTKIAYLFTLTTNEALARLLTQKEKQ